jgi:hypothetical protein
MLAIAIDRRNGSSNSNNGATTLGITTLRITTLNNHAQHVDTE